MKSSTNEEFCIMPDNPPYWRNKRTNGLVRHEVFFGVRNRQKSIDDGLVIFLTPRLHNMSNEGIHFNKKLDLRAKKIGQKTWMKYYNATEEDFRKRYGRNYL